MYMQNSAQGAPHLLQRAANIMPLRVIGLMSFLPFFGQSSAVLLQHFLLPAAQHSLTAVAKYREHPAPERILFPETGNILIS